MSSNKYYPIEKLKEEINNHRTAGRSIALANGGFDLIHIGHTRYLEQAKKTADILVVALNSDSSLKAIKGKHRAIIGQEGRVKILSAFQCVDYVTTFNEKTVDQVLLAIEPDYHCKGSDYTPETVPERKTVASYGGKIAIVGGNKVRSTSEIIKAIKKIELS